MKCSVIDVFVVAPPCPLGGSTGPDAGLAAAPSVDEEELHPVSCPDDIGVVRRDMRLNSVSVCSRINLLQMFCGCFL